MTIGDELKRAILKMQVYRDEHKKSRTHQKVLMDICQMLDPLCDGILDMNFTEVFLFGRETTEDERSKLKELWYANKTREQGQIPEGLEGDTCKHLEACRQPM